MDDRTKGIEIKKRKWENETSYFLIKELLMTERTYKRDLEILNDSFRQFLTVQDIENLHPLFEMLETMNQHHNTFLREMEHRVLAFESKEITDTRIGDIMLKHLSSLPIYDDYVQSNLDILQTLNEMCTMDTRFENIFKDFEQQSICYLPVAELMLKPLYRILHYELIFQRLCDFYPRTNIDFVDCQAVYNVLVRTTKQIRENLLESVNFVQMFELQRNITGLNKLIQKPRCFVRHGYLLKHSKRGLQQRMFILLSDFLLYGLKLPTEDKFHILGHVPVRSLLTENAEHNMFLIYGGKSAITVSAATTAEKTLWLAELSKAAENIRNQVPTPLPLTLFKNRGSSEESIDTSSYNVVNDNTMTSTRQQQLSQKMGQSRSNTALHVCWHRGATIGIGDYMRSAENQLSGYLLRKFKNSSGWQKLWVVFASFCLYFYKSFQDETALASLPILGYTVGPPAHQDAVQKDFVFKLTFKNHIYFFRAESLQTYTRWLEVLKSTTQTQDFKNMYFN